MTTTTSTTHPAPDHAITAARQPPHPRPDAYHGTTTHKPKDTP